MHTVTLSTVFFGMQILGTIFFAISGALSGYRKNFDLMGVVVMAFIVGNGGGTIRDLLIGALPVFWVDHPMYIIITMFVGAVTFFIAEYFDVSSRTFLIIDALGMGIFAITGAQKTLAMGLSPVVAVVMGVLSAVGGGIIRDVVSSEIPLILQPEIYATAALAGAIVFVLLYEFLPYNHIAGISCTATVFLIRLGTIQWGWELPTPAWLKHRM